MLCLSHIAHHLLFSGRMLWWLGWLGADRQRSCQWAYTIHNNILSVAVQRPVCKGF